MKLTKTFLHLTWHKEHNCIEEKWKTHGQTLTKQSALSQSKGMKQTIDWSKKKSTLIAVKYMWV